jgi:Leucine-rich repeat (LRR) protein
LIQLQNLDLCHNKLVQIDPYTFANLKELKKLNLSENKIKRIDKNTFKELTKLENLDLRRNKSLIHYSLDFILECANLKSLDLTNINTESIDSKVFLNFSHLSHLSLNLGNVVFYIYNIVLQSSNLI